GVPAGPFGEPVPHREHPVRVGAELAIADGRGVDHSVAVDDHETAVSTSGAHEASFSPWARDFRSSTRPGPRAEGTPGGAAAPSCTGRGRLRRLTVSTAGRPG